MSTSNLFDRLTEANWELAAGIVIIGVAWVIGARKLGHRPAVRQFPKTVALIDLIFAPLVVIAIGGFVRVLARRFGIGGLDENLRILTVITIYLVLAWTIVRVIELFVLSRSKEAASGRLPGLIRGLFRVGCLLAGLAIALAHLGYSVTGVWVSTGVAAALFGFALQKTLGDLFSGIALSIERPFKLDDWLELADGTFGQVIDINWRATRLRGWDKATHVIPNGELASQGFKNYHDAWHVYAPWYEFKIPAEVDPRFAKALLLEAALRCENVLRNPLPVVRLSNASTIPYTYMVWVHFSSYPAMFAGREELFREVHYALKSAGIQIAPEAHEVHARKAQVTSAQPPTIRLALKGLDVAARFTEEELEEVAAASRHLMFDAGTVILDQGNVADAFEIIVNGVVESSLRVPGGSWKAVDRLSPGQYFGITSMMTSDPSDFRFTALTDVTVIRIDIECVRALLDRRPALADDLAEVVQRRLESAERARMASDGSSPQPTLRDILDRIKTSLKAPRRH